MGIRQYTAVVTISIETQQEDDYDLDIPVNSIADIAVEAVSLELDTEGGHRIEGCGNAEITGVNIDWDTLKRTYD